MGQEGAHRRSRSISSTSGAEERRVRPREVSRADLHPLGPTSGFTARRLPNDYCDKSSRRGGPTDESARSCSRPEPYTA
jgi:hypothetical protein